MLYGIWKRIQKYNIQYYLNECIEFYQFMKKHKEEQHIIGLFYIIVKDLLESHPKMNIIYENILLTILTINNY